MFCLLSSRAIERQLLIRCRKIHDIDTGRWHSEQWLQLIRRDQGENAAGPDHDTLQVGYCMMQHDEPFFKSQCDLFEEFESVIYPGKNQPNLWSQSCGLGIVTKSSTEGYTDDDIIEKLIAQLRQMPHQLHQLQSKETSDDDTCELWSDNPSSPRSQDFTDEAVTAVDFEWTTIPQFNQNLLPERFVEIRNEFLGDKRLQIGKDMDLSESLAEEHQNELQILRGCAMPFPNLETYYGFLSMISNHSPKEINDTTTSFFTKSFNSWYPYHGRKYSTSVDIMGRIDFKISDPLKECRNLLYPKSKKCIIAFKCYSV